MPSSLFVFCNLNMREFLRKRWISVKFKFENGNQEIELKVKGYEAVIPTKSYWDNNWLVLSCKSAKDGKPMCGEFPCFLTIELQRLKMLLEQFRSGALSSISWNGTEPNFVLNINQNYFLTIYFCDEKDCEITFQKYATAEDVEGLIRFCLDSLRYYPVRDLGIK